MHPINGKPSSIYNCLGKCETAEKCKTNPNRITKNNVTFRLFIQSGVIRDARWEVFGDPVAIATASWCVQQVRGREIDELAHMITPEKAALALEISEELDIRAGCMAAIRAFMAALDDYSQSSPKV